MKQTKRMKRMSAIILLTVFALSLSSCKLEKRENLTAGNSAKETTTSAEKVASTTSASSDSKPTAKESEKTETSEKKNAAATSVARSPEREAALRAIREKQFKLQYVEQLIGFSLDRPKSYLATVINLQMLYQPDRSVQEFYSKVEHLQDGEQKIVESYLTGGKKYMKEGEGTWAETDAELNLSTTYDPILKSFFASEAFLDFDGSDPTKWVFQYKGKNKELLNAIKPLFSLNFNGVDENDLELTIKYAFDAEKAFLQTAEHNVFYEKGEDKLEVDVFSDFFMHNVCEEVLVPENFKQP